MPRRPDTGYSQTHDERDALRALEAGLIDLLAALPDGHPWGRCQHRTRQRAVFCPETACLRCDVARVEFAAGRAMHHALSSMADLTHDNHPRARLNRIAATYGLPWPFPEAVAALGRVPRVRLLVAQMAGMRQRKRIMTRTNGGAQR